MSFPPTGTFPFTGDALSTIEMVYVGYFARAGNPSGVDFWVGDFISHGQSQAALNDIAASFSVQPEATAEYPLLNNPLLAINNRAIVEDFVNQIFQNYFSRNAEASGLKYWSDYLQGQIAANPTDPIAIAHAVGFLILQVAFGAQTADQATLSGKVTAADFMTSEFGAAGINFTSELPPDGGAHDANNVAFLFSHEVVSSVGVGGNFTVSEAATNAFVANPPSGHDGVGGLAFLLTVGQDTWAGHGHDVFNAPLAGTDGTLPTLTNLDSLTDNGVGTSFAGFTQVPHYGPAVPSTGPAAGLAVTGAFFGSVLNASFNTKYNFFGSFDDRHPVISAAPNYVTGVNIQGIQTWNINAVNDLNKPGGSIIITGDAAIGNVISGLQYLNFNANSGTSSLYIGDNTEPVQTLVQTITVSNAVGTGQNGVDVDIAAGAFTGHDAINVVANVVGGFPLDSGGTIVVPPPILGTSGDPDSYNPNWVGYGENAYAIAAGASSGPIPPGVPPFGAVGYATWNVYSIGTNPVNTLNIIALGGDGSESATTLNLFDDGSNTMLYATFISDSLLSDWTNLSTIDLSATSGFVTLTGLEATTAEGGPSGAASYGFGGLLTDVGTGTAGVTIKGGAGNSFYDLSSFTLAAAAASHIDGGHGTNGNSEVAFNNLVVANASNSNIPGPVIDISHIQILDDTGNPASSSGGNVQGGDINMFDFPKLAPLNTPYALLAENQPIGVPPGLPFTSVATTDANGIVPVGYELLLLLYDEGSTAVTLGSDLFIYNGPTLFAINSQDMADGFFSSGGSTTTTVTLNSTFNEVTIDDQGTGGEPWPVHSRP